MQWIILVAVLAAVACAIAVAVRFAYARAAQRIELWRRFANERGHRFVPASGPWYRRTSDAIEGTCEGTPFRLDTYIVSTGKTHVSFTRVRAELERAFPGKLTLCPRSFFTGIGEALGRKTLRTRDEAFDRRFVARSTAGDSAVHVLDDDVRSRTLSFLRSPSLQVLGREVKLWWRNEETEPAVLDAAAGLVAALARACARV